jgi:hypothetical protein
MITDWVAGSAGAANPDGGAIDLAGYAGDLADMGRSSAAPLHEHRRGAGKRVLSLTG